MSIKLAFCRESVQISQKNSVYSACWWKAFQLCQSSPYLAGHQRIGARYYFPANLQSNSFAFACNMFGDLVENESTRNTGCFKNFDIILQSNNFGSSCLNNFKFTQHVYKQANLLRNRTVLHLTGSSLCGLISMTICQVDGSGVLLVKTMWCWNGLHVHLTWPPAIFSSGDMWRAWFMPPLLLQM